MPGRLSGANAMLRVRLKADGRSSRFCRMAARSPTYRPAGDPHRRPPTARGLPILDKRTRAMRAMCVGEPV